MKKIILVVLLIACLYALQIIAQEHPENSVVMTGMERPPGKTNNASFAGGLLILAAVGTGYMVRKLYFIRNSSGS